MATGSITLLDEKFCKLTLIMNPKKILGFSFLFITLPLFLEFKVPDDFTWLKEFLPLTETLTTDHWEKDTRITFDENGWVQVNKQSNPVTLSQYALVCFDTYRKTGDVKYKKSFLNQVNYLISDKTYKVLAEDRIGYPYKFIFHDLKPDWYSGLAQAEAICVLIRYYSLTRDTKVLPLIVKLKNQMLWPIENGGLLAKTPEGGPWIEEYPNSKQNKHVLNGFLISIFGLYEYTMLFPDDKKASEMYEKCLVSLKNSVGNYDTGSWLQYDRGNKTNVSNWYMKAQVIEMKLLYQITQDPYFYKLHLLWGTYSYNKPITFIGCKINERNFSIPLKLFPDGWLKPTIDHTNIVKATDVKHYRNGPIFPNHGSTFLLDKSVSSYFQPLSNDSIKSDTYAEFIFKSGIKIDRLSLLNLKDSMALYSITIEYKSDTATHWKEIKIKKINPIGKECYYEFTETEMIALKIGFKIKKNAIVMIAEMNLQYSKKVNEAQFAHHQTDPMPVNKQKMKFSFEERDVKKYTVFYRFGNSKTDIMKSKWNANDCISSVPFESESCGTFYQYLIIFKVESELSAIKNIVAS